ncbi:IS66-like element accessory protein TnpA [Paramagnetospirillum kuznetsovii]|uniref:IS66-like element accessory protein TnpA n=1 Tax=Paramagnetospirillum kuznetsovii TaxID=2053833 RepID=UPI0038990C7F
MHRRNRSWPESLKREIVAAKLEPGASVAAVARHYEVNANQVFAWRRRFGAAGLDIMTPTLVPVVLTGEVPSLAPPITPDDRIEIELTGGYRLCVGGDASAATLRRVLGVLERR